jgi:hypothetical protein
VPGVALEDRERERGRPVVVAELARLRERVARLLAAAELVLGQARLVSARHGASKVGSSIRRLHSGIASA